MRLRKNNSRFFGIGGSKHPHVLDLRSEEERPLRRQVRKPKEDRHDIGREERARAVYSSPKIAERALSRDALLEELEGIDDRDNLLAVGLEVSPSVKRRNFVRSGFARGVEAEFTPQLIPQKGGRTYRSSLSKTSFAESISRSGGRSRRQDSIHFGTLVSHFRRDEGSRGGKEILLCKVRNIRTFAFLAGIIALFLFGSFFAQKGFAVKRETTAKSVAAYENFLAAESALKSLNFDGASKNFSKAYENLISAEEALGEIGGAAVSVVENLPFESRAGSSIALLRAAKHIAKAGEALSSAFALLPLDTMLSAESLIRVFGEGDSTQGTGYSRDVFGAFEEYLELAGSDLARAEDEMARVHLDDFPEEFQGRIDKLHRNIPALVEIVGVAKAYSKISSAVLGAASPKKYLILFQNSSELRATGGFIGSYALVEIDRGNLANMFVDGIYSADGQLSVNIIPPKPLQHIATAWSTHDANWFLDFPSSARKVLWFFEQTGGEKVDGVITLNVEVIEQLLALTGPIPIAQYDLVLDAQNFRDEIQYEVEVAYDKKSNRPKQVLSDFAPIFLQKLFQVVKESNDEIVSIFMDALNEKFIMFYFNDQDVQEFFENQGWTGSIRNASCLATAPASQGYEGPSKGSSGKQLSDVPETRNRSFGAGSCQRSDYLAVVHSNIGGHKTGKYMKDSVAHRAEIGDDGSIRGHITVTRTHTGGNTQYWWYNRDNVDYVRIYVPEGSEIISFSGGQRREVKNPIDYASLPFTEDQDIAAANKTSDTSGPIDIFLENGKTVFGTWLVTKPGKSSVLEIRYTLPFGVEFVNGAGKYNLYFQKQPGTRFEAASTVASPDGWETAWTNQDAARLESFVLDTDKVIGYIFKK